TLVRAWSPSEQRSPSRAWSPSGQSHRPGKVTDRAKSPTGHGATARQLDALGQRAFRHPDRLRTERAKALTDLGDLGRAEGARQLVQLAGQPGERYLTLAPADDDLGDRCVGGDPAVDRKSTRLNSSHVKISYAVF